MEYKHIKCSQKCQVALYFLDQDHKLQQTRLELLSFDANTVNQVVVSIARS
jgi:hypothetical protein